jgi:dodecin
LPSAGTALARHEAVPQHGVAQLHGGYVMAVAKVIEIIAGSSKSFEDAVAQGIARASETLEGISSAWVKDQSVVVDRNKITEYRVTMKVTFMLQGAAPSSKKKR